MPMQSHIATNPAIIQSEEAFDFVDGTKQSEGDPFAWLD